jgi:hypothetical protein
MTALPYELSKSTDLAKGRPDTAELQCNIDILDLGVFEQVVRGFLTPHSRLLVAAERRAEEVRTDRIYPDESDFDSGCRAVRRLEVFGPD